MKLLVCCIVFFVGVYIASALVNNSQIEEKSQRLDVDARRRGGRKSRSTSSSSGDRRSKESKGDSLDMSVSSSSSDSKTKKKGYWPKSSAERRGWRKWHRKCTPCREDMKKKWRDPSIRWICGSYQSARRSFKSLCMMHYRNCQDGTMFTKIHEHRCENSSNIKPFGDHFFYEYRVDLSGDSSKTKSSTSSVESESSD